MADGKFVSYLRVSTARQGQSGLGLEAQREAVARYLNGGGWELLAEFVEVETGKGSDARSKRPQLDAAMALARKQKATLVIAKLDRLSRDVGFIDGVMKGRVPFVAADMPHANDLTLTIMAAFAQHERQMISERTKEALTAAKARGVKLGTNGVKLAHENKVAALSKLETLASTLMAMRSQGLSIRAIAEKLNSDGVQSPGGGRWHPTNTKRALDRLYASSTA
jgi:DNA invertase Pin-like site-specific DNA recombinase